MHAEVAVRLAHDPVRKVATLTVGEHRYSLFLPNCETDYIQKKIVAEQRPYELSMLEDMGRRVCTGDLVLDVGANIGNHTLYLAAVVGCQVIAFEPNPALAGALASCIEANDLSERVAVMARAVGEAEARGRFERAIPENLGAQSIVVGEGDIDIVALDDLHFDHTVKLLKIDVEGMEMPVLQGAEQLLRRDRPMIYVECLSKDEFVVVADWLQVRGYSYLESFNASPTHLFLPSEQVDGGLRLARSRLKRLLDTYRAAEQRQVIQSPSEKVPTPSRSAKKKAGPSRRQVVEVELPVETIQPGAISLQVDTRALPLARLAETGSEPQWIKERISQLDSKLDISESAKLVVEPTLAVAQENARIAEGLVVALRGDIVSLQAELEARKQAGKVLGGQLSAAKQQVILEQGRRREAEDVLSSTRQNAERDRQRQALENSELQQKRTSLLAQIEQLELDKVVQTTLLQEQLDRNHHAYLAAEEDLQISQRQARDVSNLNEKLQEQLSEERARREAAEVLLESAREDWQASQQHVNSELASTRALLDVANQKYRSVTGEQIPQLKAEMDSLLECSSKQKRKIEELVEDLQRANAKRYQAEQRLIKTRASLTYQLGYQLKAGATSLDGLVRLPGSLLSLYRQASKQRKALRWKHVGHDTSPKALPAPQQFADTYDNARPILLGNAGMARQLMLASQADGKQVRVACVMDEFSYGSYRLECDLKQLTPGNWLDELQAFQPELLFIESAWRGKDDLWGSKVGHNSQELQGIVAWCKTNGVPTAFWNKEDPIHFETFLTTARQFDFVFTTDIDCIHRYKAGLGHERVYLLPFACQPAVHNPIELYQRKDAFCFAGAYYVRYPERTRDLGNFVAELPKFRPLEIFDRNFGKDDPNYQFPAEYRPYIVGTLSFEQIDTAYKGYRYSINLNSIKQSQSMFARRVFELLGSNTITVSNFSRGLRLLFGELVICTDSGGEMLRRLNSLAGNEEDCGKLRLAALRKVMQEHTYRRRLDYVLSKALARPVTSFLPQIAVFAMATDAGAVDRLIAQLQRQRYEPMRAFILTSRKLAETIKLEDPRITLLPARQFRKHGVGELAGDARWVCGMHADDYYGPNYLLDIALASQYSQAGVVGKVAHYASGDQGIHLFALEHAYRPVAVLRARASAIETHRLAEQQVLPWLKSLGEWLYQAQDALAIDPYNYCLDGAGVNAGTRVDDLALDIGLSIEEVQARAEAIPPARIDPSDTPRMGANALEAVFGTLRSKAVTLELAEDEWRIDSTLADGKHEYLYAARELTPEEFGENGQLKLFLDTTPGLNLQLVLLMLDGQKQRISHVMVYANRNTTVAIPPETAFIRMGWRVYASGSAKVNGLLLGHRDLQPSTMLDRSRHMLLTNHYPSYGDLYRNGFVHSRVRAYREHGVRADVFRLRKDQTVSYDEFEDIDVITGSQETLDRMLASGRFESVLVHFLDPDMWEVLRKHMHQVKVVVWVHGAEIQPWWRREYNYSTDEQLALGKLESERRLAFWRNLLQPMPANLRLVFVSRYFAETVMEDLGFRIPESLYAIIHNPINTDLFSYQEKGGEQRKKILSIRPYSSRTYANDLSVRAIQALSEKPWFRELEFRMVGDGQLFEQTLEPLRQYPNVQIQRGFLKQAEIAALHKEYGVFLCPSRMDTQGVSRDEAMSSGLVPITSAVAAIPEFADSDCAYLDEPESFLGLSKGIEEMYMDPDVFSRKSIAAARRVVEQSSMRKTVLLEIGLFE
ncbi:FkbM family methyltransferase [Pseudomonas sp. SCB32]|uniref:FkbM family methyltransferase n=1 Tax=Pseudomonas sp. SCB32 TaxID=2653853 RepID=UPI002114383B|nr:FkbM family methyltransferase [Pseudomonas sp. SCB32]